MDLIERQKAINALANTKDLVDVTWTDENDNVIDSIEEKRNIIANWLEKVPPAQPDNQTNLCDSCDYSYPDCPSKNDDVIFGNGIGNDNICACNKYKPSAQPEQCEDAVSREKVKELAYSQIRSEYSGIALKEQREAMLRIADNVIGLLPSVTPKQRTGKWIFTKDYYWICSECGKNPTRGVGYVQGGFELFPHCPYCGSRNEVTT